MSTKEVPVNDNKAFVKYKVLRSEKYGRYLVARKKIDAGEVIIREKPVVIGPRVFDDYHLCFECLKTIPRRASTGNCNISCSNCQVVFFCSVACEARKFYHTIEECKILNNKTMTPFRVKEILLPLRLWLIKKKDEELWEKIMRLEAHLEVRRDTDIWKINEEKIINTLKSLGIIDKSEEKNFSELIHRICGILNVNSYDVPSPGKSDVGGLRGLYLEASLIAHDCRGNTFWTFDHELELTILATKPINDGEIIFFTYLPSLLGMADRRKILRNEKYFECDCPMCEDPQELGTNLSTIFCPYCSNGLITFASRETKDPYAKEKNWKCNKCQISLSGYLIAFFLHLVKIRIKQVGSSSKELEVLLKKLSPIFHPNHFLMLDIKRKLIAVYQIETDCSGPSKEKFIRVFEFSTNLLDILETAEPGISSLKGSTLSDIATVILHLAIIDHATGVITPKEFAKQLKESEKYLKRSLRMLNAVSPSGIPR